MSLADGSDDGERAEGGQSCRAPARNSKNERENEDEKSVPPHRRALELPRHHSFSSNNNRRRAMGLLTSNHTALLRDCYPPPPSSPSSDLPSPQSNPLGKLTFYAVNRPHKTPKVIQTLVDRARTARTAATGSGTSAGKARADLAVTVEIVRALVVEWGESGKDEAPGVIKNAVAEGALTVAELALGGGAEGGAARQQRRDTELEARGASLVRTVSPLFSLTSLT